MDPQQQHYARIHRDYSRARTAVLCNRAYYAHWTERLFGLLPPLPEETRFLELMCGQGELAQVASARYRTVVASDLSLEMLGSALPLTADDPACRVVADVRALPF